jgi:hypothetical protein
MAASICRCYGKVCGDLFRRTHRIDEWVTVSQRTTAPFIERVRRVDQVAVICDQPAHAVRRSPFLVRGQNQNDVTIRHESFAFISNEVGDEYRRHRLVVARAAAIVVAVALREDKRIEVGGPVALERGDDVEMGKQHQRLTCARPTIADDQVSLIRARPALEYVRRWKPRFDQPAGHRIRGHGGIADRVDGVDLDQLFIDIVSQSLWRGQ